MEETVVPRVPSVYGNITLAFQGDSPLIRPDGSQKDIHSFYQYLELNAVSPQDGLSFNSYLRGRQIYQGEQSSFDAYYAYLQYTNSPGSMDVRLGRQILTEGTNYHLMDGGRVKFRPADQFEVVGYAGHLGRDTQPDPENLQESASVMGLKIKSERYLESIMAVGYERIDAEGFAARNFLHASLNRVVPFVESADFYGRGEFDIGNTELMLLTTGMGMVPFRSLYLNVEYAVYEPDDSQEDYLQDRIFDLFSVSRLHQAKGGITYIVNPRLKASASYGYSRYEVSSGVVSQGHVTRLGLSWDFWRQLGLKTFQGLYFLDGREKDRAVGFNFSVSEELIRGLNLHYSFASVRFETLTGQDGISYSHAVGIQYLFIRNVLLKAEVEVIDSPDVETDTLANLVASYNFYF